jgi:hypothetical protein
MQLYLQKVTPYLNVEHKNILITRIPKEDNQWANLLFKLASSNSWEFPADVWVVVLEEPNVGKDE